MAQPTRSLGQARRLARRVLVVAVGSGLLAVAACSGGAGGSDAPTGGTLLEASDVSMRSADNDVAYHDAAAAVRALGHEMAVSALDADGNAVVSSTSLALALAMAREGAGPEAAREIDRVLGARRDPHAVYNALLHSLAAIGKGTELDIADAAFVHDDYADQIKQPFLDAIKAWFGVGVHTTHFPQPGVEDVNAWVDEQTKGRVQRLLTDVDPWTKLILVNAMYLRAAWAVPFNKDLTSDQPFTTAKGDIVDVATMHDHVVVHAARGPGWQAIELPYYDGRLAMYILLPNGAVDPASLLRSNVLRSVIGSREEAYVQLSLPRWDTESMGSLKPLLKAMGMRASFTLGAFDRVTDDPTFKLDDVVQDANVTVTEEGTVAAAATGAVFIAGGAPGLNLDFDADHPFAFAIVDRPTGMPLFEGVVADPS